MNINDRTINALQFRSAQFQQSENAELSYTINWATVLGTDTISASAWQASGNISLTSSNTDTTATVKVSGSPGCYILTNKITMASGMVDERSIRLQITVNDRDTFPDYV